MTNQKSCNFISFFAWLDCRFLFSCILNWWILIQKLKYWPSATTFKQINIKRFWHILTEYLIKASSRKKNRRKAKCLINQFDSIRFNIQFNSLGSPPIRIYLLNYCIVPCYRRVVVCRHIKINKFFFFWLYHFPVSTIFSFLFKSFTRFVDDLSDVMWWWFVIRFYYFVILCLRDTEVN